ncbi:M28 family peptidase [Chitinophaga oryzae]|uniref:M28 family peptidase n=1 Tax=Chitinophaga oryzae TaxID=2725414 RepID=A0AAE7D5C9_9BACT|nr:M28 family peptidase [Chitinophaga oryzae]QJB30493.1 M28 family peptidase [Chitinophaga oryzae]
MFNHRRIAALLLVLSLGIYTYIVSRGLVPGEIKPSADKQGEFSAARALPFLKVIAREPHCAGISALTSVRNYIADYCRSKGLETEIQKAVGFNRLNHRLLAGEAHNVIARLKGTVSGRSVLVVAHYDSQPNTPGAADNGSAVASMMENINLLQKGPRLKNDVIFLFTDLEEPGRMGAEAFVRNFPGMDSIGLVLNFDARGNAGVNYIFETSGGNSWLMQELSKALKTPPVANSFAYEVYRRMPNSSDFSVFKEKGIPGWNTAFIDGYSNYHSMTDTPENLDIRTFQQQGDLMLDAIRHFGDLDLVHGIQKDAIYFNTAGNMFWVYSYTTDYILQGITLVLFVIFLVLSFRREGLTLKSMAAGVGWYLLSILLTMGLIWGLQKLVMSGYPQYGNFYSSNAYNVGYYLAAMVGLALLVYTFWYGWMGSRLSSAGTTAGALLVLLTGMLILKWFMPTATYVLYIPLLVILLITICLYYLDIRFEDRPYTYTLAQILTWLLPISLWGTFAYILYVVFSLALPFAAGIFVCLFYPLLIGTHPVLQAVHRRLLTIVALLLVVGGIIAAHMNAGSSGKHPQPTQLMYGVNKDRKEALWVSNANYKDDWLNKYIPSAEKAPFDEFYSGFGFYVWKNKAPYSEQEAAVCKVLKDTLVDGKRNLCLMIVPGVNTNSMELYFTDKIQVTKVAERDVPHNPQARLERVSFFSPPVTGVSLECTVKGCEQVGILLVERRLGIPQHLLTDKLPANMIFGPDYISNSLQIKQTIYL